MSRPYTDLSDDKLAEMRDLAASTYLSAYVHMMARRLGIDDSNHAQINGMALQLVTPVNLATQAAWCALMEDKPGVDRAFQQLREVLDAMPEKERTI